MTELECCLFLWLKEKEKLSNLLEKIRCAKVTCEVDLLFLQEGWSKEKEEIYDKVYKQLTCDLLVKDEQN